MENIKDYQIPADYQERILDYYRTMDDEYEDTADERKRLEGRL